MIIKSLSKNLIYKEAEIKNIIATIERLSRVKSNIFFLGEGGTGKRTLAFLYHKLLWGENDKFFYHINSGNIDREIGYSMLFGHVKGAFTGAVEDKKGILDFAKTLYVSSIELLPTNLQSPLLRLLEGGEYIPLGSDKKSIFTGVIIISSTITDISKLKRSISESLFYYLNSKLIFIPPLRERTEEIIPLAKLKLRELNKRFNRKKKFSEEFLLFLKQYRFKGNIRELFNIIEKSFIESQNSNLLEFTGELRSFFSGGEFIKDSVENLISLEELKRRYFLEIFRLTGGNRTKISKILGITRKSVYNYLKKYGLLKENGKN